MNNRDISSIYNSYINDLYSYALHLGFDESIIMDAIHDVFLNLCRKKSIHEINDVKFYLFRSLKNTLLNFKRSNKRFVDLSGGNIEELPFHINVTIEESFISKEEHEITRRNIDEMLNVLTPRQKEIIYLRYTHEYDYQQISQLMNITVSACRKLVHRAITTIREKYPLPILLFLLQML